MNWQDELKKEIEDKTLLDFDELDWEVLISFIEDLLKKERIDENKFWYKVLTGVYYENGINELSQQYLLRVRNAVEKRISELEGDSE